MLSQGKMLHQPCQRSPQQYQTLFGQSTPSGVSKVKLNYKHLISGCTWKKSSVSSVSSDEGATESECMKQHEKGVSQNLRIWTSFNKFLIKLDRKPKL